MHRVVKQPGHEIVNRLLPPQQQTRTYLLSLKRLLQQVLTFSLYLSDPDKLLCLCFSLSVFPCLSLPPSLCFMSLHGILPFPSLPLPLWHGATRMPSPDARPLILNFQHPELEEANFSDDYTLAYLWHSAATAQNELRQYRRAYHVEIGNRGLCPLQCDYNPV